MTETDRIKAEIKMLEAKLSLLEEIAKHKSPEEKAYKADYGDFPVTDSMSGGCCHYTSWGAFQKGYAAGKRDWHGEEVRTNLKTSLEELANGDVRPMDDVIRESVKWCEEHPDESLVDWLKPQTLKQVESGLKEAFREAVKKGVVSPGNKPRTMTDIVYRWWDDVFTTHSDWDMETSIEDLVDQIELFLPKEQSAAGSQNVDVEFLVDGFNDAIKEIKSKLR